MAGHSKWANIKHKKAATDAKRGKLFTRLAKEISIAAKASADPASNTRLRTLIEKAREANMPNDNINRAIKRGTGEIPGAHYEAHMYEGYGPGNCAVIVEALTDNKNRTVGEIRRLFTIHNGSLGESGSVAWMFKKCGVIRTDDQCPLSEDALFELLIDYDIIDIKKDDQSFVIITATGALEDVKAALVKNNVKITAAEIEWIAQNECTLDEETEKKALSFLEALEDHDDVQNVYANIG